MSRFVPANPFRAFLPARLTRAERERFAGVSEPPAPQPAADAYTETWDITGAVTAPPDVTLPDRAVAFSGAG